MTIANIDTFAHIGGLVSGIVAGAVAEGVGSRSTRQTIAVFGFATLVLIFVAMVAARTASLA